jgi:DNA-binding winged helix-turn-helix (wHTH) protein/tetratricopeptide (TPR) repeat protein
MAWSFGPYRLEPDNAMLLRDGEPVTIAPKPFALLCFLVENAGQLVTKDQLLDVVWAPAIVAEGALTVCMNDLRQALGDDARSPRYIETVTRRGYRFVAPISRVGRNDSDVELPLLASPLLPAPADVYVGRARELTSLWHLLEGARSGDRRVVFVTGEAGIGKTTLLRQFVQGAADRGVAVLWGRCLEHFGEGEAFLPLLEAIEAQCRSQPPCSLPQRLRQLAPTWAAQIPCLMSPDDRAGLPSQILGATRERMLREGCELLESLARESPLIVVLENLQWSDYATVDLLAMLAQRLTAAFILILGSFRPEDVARGDHPIRAVKRNLQLQGLGMELAVDTLSPPEVDEYLNLRLPGEPLHPEGTRWISQRTEGHPLFLVNFVDFLIGQGRLVKADTGWTLERPGTEMLVPDTLRQMIGQSIDQQSADVQQVLRNASAIGVEFSAALLAKVMEREVVLVEAQCEDLVDHGHLLARAGVEELPDGSVSGRYAFRHGLYADVLLARLPPAQGLQLQRRIGACLEALYGEGDTERAPVIAMHYELGKDYPKALSYLMQAAEHAGHRFANPEAVNHYRNALRCAEQLPLLAQDQAKLNVLHRCATVQRSMNDLAGAMASSVAMLDIARRSGALAEEVAALVDLSRVYVWSDRRRCLEYAAEAVERSRIIDCEVTQVMARGNAAGMSIYISGWDDETAKTCREALDLARRIDTPQVLNTRLPLQSMLDWSRSDYRAACDTAEEGMRIAESLGDGYQHMICQFFKANALLALGDWGVLRQSLQASLAMADRNSNTVAGRVFRLVAAALQIEGFNFEEARDQCEAVLASAGPELDTLTKFSARILLARAHLGLDDSSRALACLREVQGLVEDEGLLMESMNTLAYHRAYCEYWLSRGDMNKALLHATTLQSKASIAPERNYLASAFGLLAKISMMGQQWDDAEHCIQQAIEQTEQADIPLAAWRINLIASELYGRRQNADQAETHRRRATETLRRIYDTLDQTDSIRASLRTHPLF